VCVSVVENRIMRPKRGQVVVLVGLSVFGRQQKTNTNKEKKREERETDKKREREKKKNKKTRENEKQKREKNKQQNRDTREKNGAKKEKLWNKG
jgi:hypothetical protein